MKQTARQIAAFIGIGLLLLLYILCYNYMCSNFKKEVKIYGKCRKIVLKNQYQLGNGDIRKTNFKAL